MIINDFFTNPERSARNVAENSQRVDSLVTDALRVMQGPQVSDAVLALKRVLGDREYNGRRGFYSFYVDQILDMYGQQNLAEGADDYLDSDPATGTDDETHELDTGPLTQDPDADYDDMMQPMEATSAAPSPAAAAAATSNNTDDGPDIMRNWDRFGKNLKPDQEITPLDSEEEEAVKNHMDRWQDRMKNLPDPFAGPTIYRRADGSEFSAGGSGDAALGSSATAVDTVAPVQSTAKIADKDRSREDWTRLLGSDPFAASGPSNAWPAGMTNREYTKQAGLGAASSEPDGNRRLNANGLMAADDHEQYMKGLVAAEKQKQKVDGSDNRFARQGKPAVTYDPFGVEIPDTSTRKIAPASKTTAPAAPAAASKTTAPAWQDIVAANKIANPNRIYPGQKLTIPGRGQYEVQPGDTLSSIAARNTQAAAIPKAKATPTARDAQSATNPIFKKYPNLGVDFPIPPAILNKLGMAPQTKQDIAQNGRETVITPAMLRGQKQADANAAAYDAKLAAMNNRKKTSVKETDVGNTMDDGFKWGSATMPMQDGSVHKYNPQTNSYSQASPPTRPNLNTSISTITRDRTTDKNGQVNQNYSDVSIATNPATGTGDYMHSQDVNGTPTTTFRQNVPAAELAKLRSQHFNEDINRMQNLAGIRKK
jgi:hypothetical protein